MEKPLKNGAILVRLPMVEIAMLRDLARQERQKTGEMITPTGIMRDAARRLIETASKGGAR